MENDFMWKTIKIYTLIILAALAGYFMLSYHTLYMGSNVEFLKKKRLTSNYSFFWAPGKRVEDILVIDTLREAGIGDLLVKTGQITKEEKDILEKQFASDPVYY